MFNVKEANVNQPVDDFPALRIADTAQGFYFLIRENEGFVAVNGFLLITLFGRVPFALLIAPHQYGNRSARSHNFPVCCRIEDVGLKPHL
jgi:hypothetical protein